MVPSKLEPNEQIRVTLSELGRVAVVHVSGEIDLATCDVVEEAVFARLAERPATLVIDLSRVGFMGSAGLSLLVQAAKEAEQLATPLHIVVASLPVLRSLEISGLDSFLPISRSVSAALRAAGD